jgi:hypothetical protein
MVLVNPKYEGTTLGEAWLSLTGPSPENGREVGGDNFGKGHRLYAYGKL